MDDSKDVPKGERLGPSDVVGVSFTVGELIMRLSRLSPDLPIFSGRNNKKGIGMHHHAFVDPSKDYISFTHLEYAEDGADIAGDDPLTRQGRNLGRPR